MSYQIDISLYRISRERFSALAEEFGGEVLYRKDAFPEIGGIEFTPIDRFTPYDLSQRFIAALQSYRK